MLSSEIILSLATRFIENEIEESAGKTETANLYHYCYERKAKGDIVDIQEFQWSTDLELAKRNLEEMIEAGRGR